MSLVARGSSNAELIPKYNDELIEDGAWPTQDK